MGAKLTKAEIFAKNITASGYGDGYEKTLKILSKLTDEELESLAYSCYRTSEKRGSDAFDCGEVYEY
ncbi:hypothetical protein [Bacillus thuringiensis]|uniref:hypothetical protein n=1 Tax=Bacillus thuringiensis TaxID=1428 RepID=UPI000BFBDC4B|nr:hypothetical protein [Bacillus thuringiensis]PGT90034.1 hypothetical protein COD17_09805 [Bacillus thuringiensis]